MIKLSNLNKFYNKKAANQIHVINDVTLELPDKGLIAIYGKSGCGKTTLLNAIGGLDKVDSGTIDINGEVFEKYQSAKWDALRNRDIGYVFQNYNLIEDKSVFENLDIALKLAGITDKSEREERIVHTLGLLGIEKYKKRRPTSLSGGQQQRVAIARALCKHPKIIIADEPTGNLDDRNTVAVMDILKQISKMCLVLLVTHEQKIVDYYADEAIMVVDGKIEGRETLGNDGKLNIQDNAVIYLKDLDKKSVGGDALSLEYYTDDGQYGDLSIKVVRQNDKYFVKLDSEAKLKISVVDSDSEVILKDAHYAARTKEETVELMDFSIIKPISASGKKITLIKGWDAYLDGLKRIFRKDKKLKRRLQKSIGIFTYLLMAVGIVFSAALFNGVYNLSPDQYVKYDRSYYQFFAGENGLDREEAVARAAEYAALTEKEGVYDIIALELSLKLSYPPFLQHITNPQYMEVINGWVYNHAIGRFAYYPADKLSDSDIIYGRNAVSDNEIVLDRKLFDYAFKEENINFKGIGYDTPDKAIGAHIQISNADEFTIVGIADHGAPSLYITEKAYYDICFSTAVISIFRSYGIFYNISNYIHDYYPNPLSYEDIQTLNAAIQKIDDLAALKETDFNAYKRAITTEVISYYLLFNIQNNSDHYFSIQDAYNNDLDKELFRLLVITDNDNALTSLSEYGLHNANDYCKLQVKRENLTRSQVLLLFTGIILIVAVINLYFMQRSSLFERIKEIGILRNIGANKASIVKIYFYEVLALMTCSSFVGYILGSVACYYGNKISFIYYNFWAAILALLLIVGLQMLFGLLPVLSLLRKTPNEITAKYDI